MSSLFADRVDWASTVCTVCCPTVLGEVHRLCRLLTAVGRAPAIVCTVC